EAVSQLFPRGDVSHGLVRGDDARVEVDGVVHRAGVLQHDFEGIPDLATQRWPHRFAVEGPPTAGGSALVRGSLDLLDVDRDPVGAVRARRCELRVPHPGRAEWRVGHLLACAPGTGSISSAFRPGPSTRSLRPIAIAAGVDHAA